MIASKRVFDVTVTVLGMLVAVPLMVGIAALIAVMSGFPVFFRQERVGRNGIPFQIVKFRTMVRDAERQGGQITVGYDRRATRVGGWLRRTKLDELPQLFNVLKGDMSLVGPRPEVLRYVEQYTEAQREVLRLTPGITDPASIKFRDEAEVLATYREPEAAYRGVILPEKIRLNLEYAKGRTLISDIGILLKTIWFVWH